MDTEQQEINAAVEEAILENADAFISADVAVDEIMAWAEQEINEKEAAILRDGGGAAEFKAAAEEIEAEVARRLKALETDVANRFPEPSES